MNFEHTIHQLLEIVHEIFPDISFKTKNLLFTRNSLDATIKEDIDTDAYKVYLKDNSYTPPIPITIEFSKMALEDLLDAHKKTQITNKQKAIFIEFLHKNHNKLDAEIKKGSNGKPYLWKFYLNPPDDNNSP